MLPTIPAAAEPLVEGLRGVFTRPTFERFVVLMTGLIVTMGRRTVSRALRAVEPFLEGHWCDYHRIYSHARFSMWTLAAVLVRRVVDRLLPADAAVVLLADDTVDGRDGDHVWAKGTHRDPLRSSRARNNLTFGHRWLVMCVLVRVPGAARPWALPVLCGLCVSPKVGGQIGRRPKAPGQLAKQLLIRLMRWFPRRRFVLVGDAMVVTHDTVAFARRHADRVTAIGRLRADACFYSAPAHPARRARGGAVAKKGHKLPPPGERVGQLTPAAEEVPWYGGGRRAVRYVTEGALWYDKHGCRVTPIRWVCVIGDRQRNLENAYFYSSDPGMDARRIIELYVSRWNIEVTFEEVRAHLGLETTRHWCRRSVLRVTPLVLGLFTAVSLIWSELAATRRTDCWERLTQTPCYHKSAVTFADVLYLVRRDLWEQGLLRHRGYDQCLTCLPPDLRTMLLTHLAAAA